MRICSLRDISKSRSRPAGRRLWPTGDDAIDWNMEFARVPIYMIANTEAIARGVLEYDGWSRLSVAPGNGTDAKVSLGFSLFGETDAFRLDGKAGVEDNARLYIQDGGL